MSILMTVLKYKPCHIPFKYKHMHTTSVLYKACGPYSLRKKCMACVGNIMCGPWEINQVTLVEYLLFDKAALKCSKRKTKCFLKKDIREGKEWMYLNEKDEVHSYWGSWVAHEWSSNHPSLGQELFVPCGKILRNLPNPHLSLASKVPNKISWKPLCLQTRGAFFQGKLDAWQHTVCGM